MSKNTKTVILLLIAAVLIAAVPLSEKTRNLEDPTMQEAL